MLFYLIFYIALFSIDNYYSYLDFIIHTLLTLIPLLIVVAFYLKGIFIKTVHEILLILSLKVQFMVLVVKNLLYFIVIV